jgi:hypothetical protein
VDWASADDTICLCPIRRSVGEAVAPDRQPIVAFAKPRRSAFGKLKVLHVLRSGGDRVAMREALGRA